jgi:hypothetical protein
VGKAKLGAPGKSHDTRQQANFLADRSSGIAGDGLPDVR